MSDLKPCPFCGATTANTECIGEPPEGCYETQCGTCQAYTWGETQDAAEAAWNRRPGTCSPRVELVTDPETGKQMYASKEDPATDDWKNWTPPGDLDRYRHGEDWLPTNADQSPDPIAARDLAWLISDYSETAICASWMSGIEVILWDADPGDIIGFENEPVTAGLLEKLRELSAKCGGWIVWGRGELQEKWIPLAEWEMKLGRLVTASGEVESVSPTIDELRERIADLERQLEAANKRVASLRQGLFEVCDLDDPDDPLDWPLLAERYLLADNEVARLAHTIPEGTPHS